MLRPPPPTNRPPAIVDNRADEAPIRPLRPIIQPPLIQYIIARGEREPKLGSTGTSPAYSSDSEWVELQNPYLFDDTQVPNGAGTFVTLDSLSPPPPPPSPLPPQDTEEPEEPEDTGAGIGI